MISLAMMLVAAAPAPTQILGGKAFEKLAERTEAKCPAKKVRSITPGELDFMQEGFEAQLSPRDRARLQSSNVSARRCADRDGLSCPTIAALEAMDKVGLAPRFTVYICTHPDSLGR